MLADGGIYNYFYPYKVAYKTVFVSDEEEIFVSFVREVIRKNLGIQARIYKSSRDKEIQLYSNRKDVYFFFKELGFPEKKDNVGITFLQKFKTEEMIGGLFDGDGCWSVLKGGKGSLTLCIRFKSKNRKIMEYVSNSLNKLGIINRVYGDELKIFRINSVRDFIKTIPLFHPKWKGLRGRL